ncbi:DUF4403 family protein [Pararhodonellum marinum]|uniref:DUF4403 family protein n=1 Tax=Pararhodonellum marinum TaxID=2755358 RepID=UPI00188FC609|nr:DUF4403 family protein [Pararhodonellum marinum]
MRRIQFLILLILALSACKKINPEKPKYSGDPISLPKATSRVNVALDIPLIYIQDNLNRELSEQLFEGQSLPFGNGLSSDLSVKRTGEVSLSAKNNQLLIKMPLDLKGILKVEKKVFGQLISTNIPFDEQLIPEISFEPEIGKNWDLSLKNLEIVSWGRSMKYNLLGYEIDLDPLIRGQLQKILNKEILSGNLNRLSFKHFMEETWEVYGEPYKVDQEGIEAYVYTIPQKIKVKEVITNDQHIRLYIGLEGEVFTQIGSKPDIKPSPLPNLFFNDMEDSFVDVVLPLRLSYKDLDRYLNDNFKGKVFALDKSTKLIPGTFESQSFGDRALVKMGFRAIRKDKKDISGDIFLVGKPQFDHEMEAIYFEDIDFDLNSKNLLASTASWMKQGQVLNQIRKMSVYPIGGLLRDSRRELQKLGYFETDYASFRLMNPDLEVEDIYTTEEDIRIYLRSTGQLDVRLKQF